MPQCYDESGQDPVEEDWNGASEPALFRIQAHPDHISQNHGCQIEIAERQNSSTEGRMRTHEKSVTSGEVNADLAEEQNYEQLRREEVLVRKEA